MSDTHNVDGMTLAHGVVETIISIAASEVEGVASVGSFSASGIRSFLGQKPSTAGITVEDLEDGRVHITIHIEVYYGFVLPELAQVVRNTIAEALSQQVGLEVASIDIYVDGIQFS